MTEPPPNARLAQSLTYAGTLPLIACAAAVWMPRLLDADVVTVDVAAIAVAYGAIIASFVSGIHWAASVFFPQRCGYLPLIASNAVALLAWLCLLWDYAAGACMLLALCFVALFAVDRRLHAQAVLPTWFYRLRRNATTIVVSMLLLMALAQR